MTKEVACMMNQSNLACKNCPYIMDEYEVRERYLLNKEYDFPEISMSCYCDKVGGKLGWCGYCSDALQLEEKEEQEEIDFHNLSKNKHRNRRNASKKYKKKLKEMSINCNFYPSPSYPVDKYGNYCNDESKIAYYKEVNKSKHSSRYRFCKKMSNKKVRRHLGFESILDTYCFHEEWMDEEYTALYHDEYGYEWESTPTIDLVEKYSLGKQRSAYKKLFDYAWEVD